MTIVLKPRNFPQKKRVYGKNGRVIIKNRWIPAGESTEREARCANKFFWRLKYKEPEMRQV
ncbi:hypothetical protein BGP75_14450 [Motiliproteus sp. MSK22-1]|nr:hypothetical protein BGP75_14450 [Motiliproteus sp. MSK22-1]